MRCDCGEYIDSLNEHCTSCMRARHGGEGPRGSKPAPPLSGDESEEELIDYGLMLLDETEWLVDTNMQMHAVSMASRWRSQMTSDFDRHIQEFIEHFRLGEIYE